MGHFSQGGSTIFDIAENYNALIYVLDGQMKSNGVIIDAVHLAVFDHNSDQVRFKPAGTARSCSLQVNR
jgi:redox-sensitive bicupin YhaK (pirin superfamily)